MVEYICINCGDVTKDPVGPSKGIQCSKCDHKIFLKVRQPVARRVKAR